MQTDAAFTLDYEGELPDIGEDVTPMEESTDMDIVSEGTDEDSAINKILRGESAVEDIESKADEFPEKKSWLQRLLGYNEGGVATAIQESRDIETGADTRTKQEMLSDQMAGLGVVGKTAVESVPGVG